jgi:hypothetical protein
VEPPCPPDNGQDCPLSRPYPATSNTNRGKNKLARLATFPRELTKGRAKSSTRHDNVIAYPYLDRPTCHSIPVPCPIHVPAFMCRRGQQGGNNKVLRWQAFLRLDLPNSPLSTQATDTARGLARVVSSCVKRTGEARLSRTLVSKGGTQFPAPTSRSKCLQVWSQRRELPTALVVNQRVYEVSNYSPRDTSIVGDTKPV